MLSLSSMASLTSDDHMFALLFLIHNVAVARLACIVAGEGHWPGRGLSNRSAAIVPILPKAARDDSSAQHDECNHRDRHDGRQPDEVLYVFKQVRLPAPVSGRELRNVLS